MLEMIKIGGESILKARTFVITASKNEIYNRIKDENKDYICELEREIIVQKEIMKKYKEDEDEKIEKQMSKNMRIYKLFEEEKNDEINKLRELLFCKKEELKNNEKQQESLINDKINEIIKVEREKYELLLNERDKRLDMMRETLDKSVVAIESITTTTKKSLVALGQIGEENCQELLDTSFKFFEGYELIDKHNEGKKGDFHLKFKDFNVLVDAKNYTNKVPTKETVKIKKDLRENKHINFAWLISLNTKITHFEKSQIMYEWVDGNKCVCYVNDLLSLDNPVEMLRVLWFSCNQMNNLIIKEDIGEVELSHLKMKQAKLIEKVSNIKKGIKEIKGIMNNMNDVCERMEQEVSNILNEDISSLLDENYELLVSWWNNNIEYVDDKENLKMSSTEIWYKCKSDNEGLLKDFKPNNFREFLRSFLSSNLLTKRTKNENSAFEIKNIRWKSGVIFVKTNFISNL